MHSASLPPGRAVEESENLRLRQDGGLHSLHIAHVGSEDEGLYAVSATNTHGQAHCSAQLYVEEPRTAATGPRYCLGPELPGLPLWGPSPACDRRESSGTLGSFVIFAARSWRRCHPSLRSQSTVSWSGCPCPTSCGRCRTWK